MSERFDPYYTWLGIPPHEQPANYYRLLGLSRFESNLEVISNAADRLMLHLRGFQAGQHGLESQQLLNAVALARVTLLDAEKKSAYDAVLGANFSGAPPIANSAHELPPIALPADVLPEAVIAIEVASPHALAAPSTAFRRSTPRRRKPMPRVLVVALVAAALVALGGGIAFWLSRAGGLRSWGKSPAAETECLDVEAWG